MTFLETSWTLADASATAVSAMISAWMEPKPPVTLLCDNWEKLYYPDISKERWSQTFGLTNLNQKLPRLWFTDKNN